MDVKSAKKAALYCRTEKSDATAIQRQLDELRQYASENGLEYKVYMDSGYSGLSSDRPAFRQMLCDINAGKNDKLVALEFSRYGRNAFDTMSLLHKQISQYCVEVFSVHEGNITAEIGNRLAHYKSLAGRNREELSR